MKRAPIVLAGTGAGLAAVISYHVSGPRPLPLAALSGSTAAGAGTSSSGGGTGGQSSGNSGNGASGGSSAGGASTSAPSQGVVPGVTPNGIRAASGTDVQYPFGNLQVQVTENGGRITNVAIIKANVLDAQSGAIDQIALPELRSEALSAQSARINGVAGATYTSAAYAQSLQAAIDKLKA